MTLLLAGFGLLLLWWLGRNALRRSPARTARLLRRIGGYGALAAAGLVLVRGRPELGVILVLAGLWLLEGGTSLRRRWRAVTNRVRGGGAYRRMCTAGRPAGVKTLSRMPTRGRAVRRTQGR